MLTATDYKIIDMCQEGLRTDGEHHKQWCIEQILLLMAEKIKEEVESDEDKEKGIPS